MEVATKATISLDGVVSSTVNLDDIVGDQGKVLFSITAAEGTTVRARLYAAEGIIDEVSTVITKCPTATATPTNTATPAPTSTPVLPTATAVPPTPIVIFVPAATVAPSITTVISPPKTGDGGLLP